MFYDKENEEKIDNEFLNEKFDTENCLEEKYNKYKIIFKIIIFCLSLLIIIIKHFPVNIIKKNFTF